MLRPDDALPRGKVCQRNVQSPNQTVEGQIILDVWARHFTVGGGRVAMQLLSNVCISALHMGFSPRLDDPVFRYHSPFGTVD
ncbi:hypothetical protein IFM47457_05557 [Aspergillus lentulus]|nr:hypothetical protein IFM47457_05557 [Aspergillus lentulus]